MVLAKRQFGIYANKTFAKGKLKIFPMGQVALVKELKDNMHVIKGPSDSIFQIVPPRVDLDKMTGVLVPFFHLVKSQNGNMETTMAKTDSGFQVPFLRNISKVEQGTFLTLHCPDEEPKKGKGKRARGSLR